MKHITLIIGNVGRDAEMRFTPSGKAVTNFPVAVNEKYTTGDGEQVKKTIWYRVTVWGRSAEACNQYVKKGMLVHVEGRLQAGSNGNPRIWTDDSGAAHTNFELNASDVKFLSKSGDGQSGHEQAGPDVDDEEMPF